MAKFYFSLGDFGNIIGFITNYYKIKFGHFGLFINIYKEMCIENLNIDLSNCNNFDEKLYLTDDPLKICEFFQLDYSLWDKLNTEIEIFNWICSSPYFTIDIYENINSKKQQQVNTRPMHNRFINWIEKKENSNKQFEKHDRRMEAIQYFKLESKLDDIIILNKIIQERKNKFNGNKIMEYNFLESNKELGDFIVKFKKYIIENNGNFDEWLDKNCSEIIDTNIKLFIPVYNANKNIIKS
jgi:hypothetical protein